jgi:hypothetical protein
VGRWPVGRWLVGSSGVGAAAEPTPDEGQAASDSPVSWR